MIKLHVTLAPRRLRSARGRTIASSVVVAAALPVLALASPVDLPYTFESGAPVVAAEFNETFEAVADAVDDNDVRIGALEDASDGGVASGAVVFYDATECPEGWTELAEARGRAVVGMNGPDASLLGTVGEGLGDLENRSHAHTTDVPDVTSTSTAVDHTHSIPAHSTDLAGTHNHQWKDGAASYSVAGALAAATPIPVQPGTFQSVQWGLNTDFYTDNDGAHEHAVAALVSGAAGDTDHSHSVNPPPTASTSAMTGQVIPYLQLLACRRD